MAGVLSCIASDVKFVLFPPNLTHLTHQYTHQNNICMKLALLPPNQIVRYLSTRRNLPNFVRNLSLNKQKKKENSFQDCPKPPKEQKQKKKEKSFQDCPKSLNEQKQKKKEKSFRDCPKSVRNFSRRKSLSRIVRNLRSRRRNLSNNVRNLSRRRRRSRRKKKSLKDC